MKIYKGSVLFIDILGIGALTTTRADIITRRDFDAFSVGKRMPLGNQVFCAVILSQFRKNLRLEARPNLRIAQLSDCAFIWSSNADSVLEAARSLFWRNLRCGLLCRGGLTYGEIVEPDRIGRGIGDFVCGEAVTRSVNLERTGKGSRIFIDQEIGGLSHCNTPANVFMPVSSAITFETIDEYLWFALPEEGEVRYDVSKEHIMSIIDLALRLRFAQHFNWNAISDEGRLHLGATIERMSMFAKGFCRKKKLPFPEFAFVSCEMFIEMQKQQISLERDGQKLDAFRRLSDRYRRDHLKTKSIM